MKEENISGSHVNTRSPDQKQKVKTHAERRVKLNDTLIKKQTVKYKNGKKIVSSIGDSEVPGLRIYINKCGSKKFYFCYKTNNQKHTVRYPIGSFNIINVPQARDKAKKYAAAIVDGKDPVQIKRELKGELTTQELIEKFYKERFKANFGYKAKTIQAVKTCFKVWVFKKTVSRAVMEVQEQNPYTLQHKKLSTITTDDIKILHNFYRVCA